VIASIATGWPALLLFITTTCGPVVATSTCGGKAGLRQEPDDRGKSPVAGLVNRDFEQTSGGIAKGWILVPAGSGSEIDFQLDQDKPFEGKQSLRVDSTQVPAPANSFANAMQLVDAKVWRGKRVRFRAAVRTAELAGDARAQLWMRVDRKPAGEGTQPLPGFLDNMDDRPIRSGEWSHYEIVGDVAQDAENIALGMLVAGAGKAWLDDASIEEVFSGAVVTGGRGLGGEPDFATQPFWTWWLVLPAIGIGLMLPGQWSDGWLGRFAFRFSFCYWLLYFLPAPLGSLVPRFGYIAESLYGQRVVDPAVRWTAATLMGIDKALVPPGGSGDSTFSHVQLLMTFVLALFFALVWSVIRRVGARAKEPRKPIGMAARISDEPILASHSAPILADLLRSYVRYCLAFILLSYGLAKLLSEGGQFSPPGVDQLEKTWGDSSPMNVLWTFMGFSWHYTFFGGLGEVVGVADMAANDGAGCAGDVWCDAECRDAQLLLRRAGQALFVPSVLCRRLYPAPRRGSARQPAGLEPAG
jgi:hypothetical protein